jgi:hypothetical protein
MPALMNELKSELVTVRAELKSAATSVHIVEPKSARSRRTINLPAIVRQSLSQHRVQQLKDPLHQFQGSPSNRAGFCFDIWSTSCSVNPLARSATRKAPKPSGGDGFPA